MNTFASSQINREAAVKIIRRGSALPLIIAVVCGLVVAAIIAIALFRSPSSPAHSTSGPAAMPGALVMASPASRGLQLLNEGRAAEAETLFRQAIAAAPQDAEVHFYLGAALTQLGRPQEALASFAESLRINPNLAEAHYNSGNIYKGWRDMPKAQECYEKAIAQRPAYVEAHVQLASTLHAQAKLDKAEKHFREALRLNPSLVLAYDGLGRVLFTVGRTDDAIATFRKGLELDPNNASILEALKTITPPETPAAEEVPNPFEPPTPLITPPK